MRLDDPLWLDPESYKLDTSWLSKEMLKSITFIGHLTETVLEQHQKNLAREHKKARERIKRDLAHIRRMQRLIAPEIAGVLSADRLAQEAMNNARPALKYVHCEPCGCPRRKEGFRHLFCKNRKMKGRSRCFRHGGKSTSFKTESGREKLRERGRQLSALMRARRAAKRDRSSET